MMAIYPDPNTPDPNSTRSILYLVFWIIVFIVMLLTLPGCQTDDQKQQYRPYYDPPSKRTSPMEKIRKPIQGAADRVDEVLEKTPVPAVAGILAEDALNAIEKVETITVQEPDPEVIEIIDPEPDPLYEPQEQSESDIESDSSTGIGLVIFIAFVALIYLAFKLLKGMNSDVEDTERS
ncbi:hypothetical protein [Gimesia aquarii]|uniref:Uncharacterized protein n=1 Tax=Gimesia aquarii TaxID=2527964 RepID=A0A517VR86_9PLAN|nr:hypothetical protein [Gimesia aquarii]QDT95538.1 hypothetical protein V144x_09830 [Gimesia aquarii]